MPPLTHWIGGRAVAGQGPSIPVLNPATAQPLADLTETTPDQVHAAVTAARAAFDSGPWPHTSVPDRQAILRRAAAAIRANTDALADLQVAEGGMPRAAVLRQVAAAAGWFNYYADFLTTEAGHTHRQLGPVTTLVERVPIGVCALYSPWNVPLGLTAIKLAPALAAGNTVVLKPSEETPATVRRLVDLVHGAGLPGGVLNCVNGRGPVTGAALADHPGVDMISFTGGPQGGASVAQAAARRHVPCVMELGGKSATVIFADADLDAALDAALAMAYGSNGQACLAGSRLILDAAIADGFLARFQARAGALTLGDPTDPATDIGPLISARHRDNVLGFYDSARAEGDTILFGGPDAGLTPGFHVRPGAIRVRSTASRVWRAEVFGPLVAVATFETEPQAIALANDSDHGLSGHLWTRDLGRAMRVSRAIRTGTIVVNSPFLRDLNAPFGGFKASGVGREGGAYSWHNFTEAKTTVIHHGESPC